MTAPRIIVPGATTAITRRTKAFLGAWHPGVGQAWLYSLALAQKHTGVAIHHATRVLTHHHLTVTPERANLPDFLAIAHHELSCALNTLLARERYDQPGELFDGRATHLMRLCDDAAQSTQLVYEYLDPVAAGLVRRPEHMPGSKDPTHLEPLSAVLYRGGMPDSESEIALEIENEFAGAALPDARLSRRLQAIVSRLSTHPAESFPRAMRDASELEALYRFVNNSRVEPSDILEPHFALSARRGLPPAKWTVETMLLGRVERRPR